MEQQTRQHGELGWTGVVGGARARQEEEVAAIEVIDRSASMERRLAANSYPGHTLNTTAASLYPTAANGDTSRWTVCRNSEVYADLILDSYFDGCEGDEGLRREEGRFVAEDGQHCGIICSNRDTLA